MAQFGPMKTPFTLGDDLSSGYLMASLPQGNLIDVEDDFVGVDTFSATVQGAFFYPPSANGFMVTVDADLQFDRFTKSITNAVHPEGSYLEPTTGQIWPR